MKITHKIDTFLAALFPNYKESNYDLEVLKAEIAKYYNIGPFKPAVGNVINGEWPKCKMV